MLSNFCCALLLYFSVFQVSPVDLREGYLTYCTNKYRLHLFETPSRLKFVLNTDVAAQGIKELLHQIYTQVRIIRKSYGNTQTI